MNEFDIMLEKASNENVKMIILGYFNCNQLKPNTRVSELKDVMMIYHQVQKITSPMRICETYKL